MFFFCLNEFKVSANDFKMHSFHITYDNLRKGKWKSESSIFALDLTEDKYFDLLSG